MVLDNYINSAITFLSIFNLKFVTHKIDVLKNLLDKNGNLDIYDMSNKSRYFS